MLKITNGLLGQRTSEPHRISLKYEVGWDGTNILDGSKTFDGSQIFDGSQSALIFLDLLLNNHIYYQLGTGRTSTVYVETDGISEQAIISWTSNLLVGTKITVETRISKDLGVTWKAWHKVVSGQEIPGLSFGMDLTNYMLQIRQTLTTNNPLVTPELLSCKYIIQELGALNCTAADCKNLFDGRIDSPSLTETQLSAKVKSKLGLGKQTPSRTFSRPCQLTFGTCGASLGEVTGTVSAISSDGLTLTLSGRTEAEGWFKNGPIFINGDWRRALSSNGTAIAIDYAFDNITVGDNYIIQRRCDQTWDDCNTRFSNTANYGGFLGIPQDGYTVKRF